MLFSRRCLVRGCSVQRLSEAGSLVGDWIKVRILLFHCESRDGCSTWYIELQRGYQCFFISFPLLRIEPRASYMLSEHSTTELQPPISSVFLSEYPLCVCVCDLIQGFKAGLELTMQPRLS